jgi:hypothetical protein
MEKMNNEKIFSEFDIDSKSNQLLIFGFMDGIGIDYLIDNDLELIKKIHELIQNSMKYNENGNIQIGYYPESIQFEWKSDISFSSDSKIKIYIDDSGYFYDGIPSILEIDPIWIKSRKIKSYHK